MKSSYEIGMLHFYVFVIISVCQVNDKSNINLFFVANNSLEVCDN